jgi:hypothetical protein
VFKMGSSASEWHLESEIYPSCLQSWGYFGTSVEGLSDSLLAVLSDSYVSIYSRNGSIWSLEQDLSVDDVAYTSFPTYSVQLSGSGSLLALATNVDKVYIYERMGALGWSQAAEIRNGDSQYFGYTVNVFECESYAASSSNLTCFGSCGDYQCSLDEGCCWCDTYCVSYGKMLCLSCLFSLCAVLFFHGGVMVIMQ